MTARAIDRSVDEAIDCGHEAAERLALLQKRDAILDMLRCEVAAKVDSVAFKANSFTTLDAWLLDLANNLCQGLAE